MNRRAAGGFTLIEVLVTVFVVAIGLLSAAALQAMSKKAAFDAVQRTTASALAQDIVERIHGNSARLADYASQGASINASNPPDEVDCASTADCSDAQIVGYDLWQWWRGLDGANETIDDGGGELSSAGGLRTATGCISREASSCRVTVTIAWRGVTPIEQGSGSVVDPDDPTTSSCGSSEPDYDDPADAAANDHRYRRVLLIQADLGDDRLCP